MRRPRSTSSPHGFNQIGGGGDHALRLRWAVKHDRSGIDTKLDGGGEETRNARPVHDEHVVIRDAARGPCLLHRRSGSGSGSCPTWEGRCRIPIPGARIWIFLHCRGLFRGSEPREHGGGSSCDASKARHRNQNPGKAGIVAACAWRHERASRKDWVELGDADSRPRYVCDISRFRSSRNELSIGCLLYRSASYRGQEREDKKQ